MQYLVYSLFAQAYGEGAYGSSAYGGEGSTVTSTSSSGGALTDTGLTILAVATFACLVIFVALLIRFWRRPSKASSNQ